MPPPPCAKRQRIGQHAFPEPRPCPAGADPRHQGRARHLHGLAALVDRLVVLLVAERSEIGQQVERDRIAAATPGVQITTSTRAR